jgi:predicted TIM-barrel fold metal-dependent hydrolase
LTGIAGDEPALDPSRPIIDPHLHLWEILPAPGLPQEPQCFLLPELLATVQAGGHAVTHSVFVECHQMYRHDGPQELRSLGETEFANGIGARNLAQPPGTRSSRISSGGTCATWNPRLDWRN